MSDFDTFKASFKGDVVTPKDSHYAKAISRWARNAERNAKIVAFVKDEEDVSLAIKYATLNSLPLAIRGGGHSAAGASSSEDGLVIDLSRYLNGVAIDVSAKTASVGGGATWEVVDKAAIEHGLATPGGTVNHTGVGGYTLGGGYGYLSGLHGLAIDNLLEATVVSADGSILTASDKSNPDLFWGIRGGGGNFGVVTRFVFRLHPQHRSVYAGLVVFPAIPEIVEKLVAVIDEWWARDNHSTKGTVHTVVGPGPDGKLCIVAVLFYNGPETEGRVNFQSFFDLQPVVNTCGEIPYETLNTLINDQAIHGRNIYMKGTSATRPQIGTFTSILTHLSSILPTANSHNMGVRVVYELIPPGVIMQVPASATAFRSRGQEANVLILIGWDGNAERGGVEETRFAREAAKDLIDRISRGEPEHGEADNNGYTNYESDTSLPVERMQRLFGDNYPRLQELKKRYDPQIIFNKWCPIQVPA